MAKRIQISEITVADVFRLEDNQRIVNAERVAHREVATDGVIWLWKVTVVTETKA